MVTSIAYNLANLALSTSSTSKSQSVASMSDAAAAPAMVGASAAHIKRNNGVKAFFKCAAPTLPCTGTI